MDQPEMSRGTAGGGTLSQVRKGMRVVDRENREIGTVDQVHAGPALPRTGGDQQEHYGDRVAMNSPEDDDLFEAMESVFEPVDEMAEDLRQRLSRQGFIRVQGDQLLGQDRYIGADLIASISGDRVQLSASLNELVRR